MFLHKQEIVSDVFVLNVAITPFRLGEREERLVQEEEELSENKTTKPALGKVYSEPDGSI